MQNFGIVDLYDADTLDTIHTQVICKLNTDSIHVYLPLFINTGNIRMFNLSATNFKISDDFYDKTSMRAFIDLFTNYEYPDFTPSNFWNIKSNAYKKKFEKNILPKIYKNSEHLLGKTFVPVENIQSGVLKLVEISNYIQMPNIFDAQQYFFVKEAKNDTWHFIASIYYDRNINSEKVKGLYEDCLEKITTMMKNSMYTCYIKQNYKNKFQHRFTFSENCYVIHSKCSLEWFTPPKPSLSLLKEFR